MGDDLSRSIFGGTMFVLVAFTFFLLVYAGFQ